MPNFQPQRLLTPMTVVLALLGAWATPTPADAAEQAVRLSISADLQRQARTQLGAEAGRMQLSQRAEYSITLVSDGERLSSNPLDPDEPARLAAAGQRAQQTVNTGLAAVAARTTSHAAGRNPAPAMDMAAMQAMAQRLQAQCGSDRDCLMREASRFSARQVAAQTGGSPATAARLQAYGTAVRDCERQHAAGPAREACTNRARVQAGGEADAPEEADAPTPYLLFRALANCQPAGRLTLEERITGSFADVQGQVAFSETRQAEDGKSPAAFPCGTQLAVLDTRSGRLWVASPLLGLEAHGTAVRSERGRAPQRQAGAQRLDWHEAGPWLNARLLQLDRQGNSAETTLPAGPDGKTQVRLQWRWQTL